MNWSKIGGEWACGRGPVRTGLLCLFDGPFWKGVKKNVKVCVFYYDREKSVFSWWLVKVCLFSLLNYGWAWLWWQRRQWLKFLECWNEHVLWRQTEFEFSVIYKIALPLTEFLNLPGVVVGLFLICENGVAKFHRLVRNSWDTMRTAV